MSMNRALNMLLGSKRKKNQNQFILLFVVLAFSLVTNMCTTDLEADLEGPNHQVAPNVVTLKLGIHFIYPFVPCS